MSLSPSAKKICTVAVDHFAEFGYDASSLTVIAEQAGMRKASLYAHFANKDALFNEVMDIALREERLAASNAFAAESGVPLPGGEYLNALHPRYASSADFRFLLRTVYAPPLALREEVITKYRLFEADLRSLFIAALPRSLDPRNATTLVDAYLGIVDSLQVELIYNSPENYEARHRALWEILQRYPIS
ncbi:MULTISPECIES: TetR/AcrR family transcriptional regulator [Micrococcaceae]|uniref:TetR/AcrR family transcriptional regulator n=1 Tax=Micrococcaceae TaxID=1268 RepID=UPI002649A141|nr:TetR/AcrR family transcriptional regulator [Yaniella sp.]MDN5823611.1 TetR/AcrR family transcriptional regulator [Micrococcaceae bacterium]MDN5816054.1 TetR/AcrR family transcriptional regulator [Yaniella sp.]MDN5878453.1 TetR/AcrR family transcriptional regulator [Micrococcaceae bacterium]MDN5886729.1 TetR/AcrR family transcriptional regulator [Micrococcaceae bacterium]MDN6169252.1 TetR/AcrR family transcriptional regulator [Micrococcaceae bacterium]